MKRKIMYITQSNGGVFKYLKMLFKYLNSEKYENILVCSRDYADELNDFKDLVNNIELVDMCRSISIKNDIKACYQIKKLIELYNPDLIYVQSSKAGAIGRLANIIFRKPIIYNPHGWAFNMNVSKKKKKIYLLIEKVLSNFCDCIVCISDQERKSALLNKICTKNKLKVILNGIDIREYEESIIDCNKLKKQLKIPEDSLVIGMVGRISSQKAPDTFIKVAAKIKEKIENTFFIIVGDGEDRKSSEALISELGLEESFLVTGWVENPYHYIQLFDIAMLLSRWEGFGLAIAEYMVCKKPIIATNVDAIPNLVVNNKTGLLVEVDNVKEIVKTTLNIINNLEAKENLVKNAEYIVRKNYDVKRVALEHEKLIENIIKNNYKKLNEKRELNFNLRS